MPQTNAPQNSPQKNGKGYGGRPLWQWILLYLVLAIIVYGIIYLIFFHHSGSGSGGGFSY
jgi:flagellar basal body-associated protein FliL